MSRGPASWREIQEQDKHLGWGFFEQKLCTLSLAPFLEELFYRHDAFDNATASGVAYKAWLLFHGQMTELISPPHNSLRPQADLLEEGFWF